MSRAILPDFSAVRGYRLIVALSGGADSTALLAMLVQAREALGLTLYAVHVNHSMRGDDALADAEFCRTLCREWDVPLTVETVDVPRLAAASKEGLETAARRLRYDCLRREKDARNARWIVLAHHLDDQAETILMHLLRGCGPEGIGGMETFSGDLYRPLLDVPKRALEDWLRSRNIPWCVDRTNFEVCTPRNALRLHGLPALEESYPKAAHALARYGETARCEDRMMTRLTDTFLQAHLDRGPYGLRLRAPETADEAILRRCLRRLAGADLSHDRLLELSALCKKTRGKITLPGELWAERTPSAIYFLRKPAFLPHPAALPEDGIVSLEGLGQLRVRPWEAISIRDEPFRQVLRAEALAGAVLRTRRDGDRIRPLGAKDRLLSDVLTDKKIDRPLRDTLPLVAKDGRILWAVGVCIAEEAKIRKSDEGAVLLEWLGDPGANHVR